MRRSPIPCPDAPDGIVLYDGVCLLCSRWFRFVAARDPAIRFRFAAVQGGMGRALALRLGIDPDNPDTNAVVVGGTAYFRSDAALVILRRLPGWRWTAVFAVVPRPVRDAAYVLVARNRYRLFGRSEICLVPGPELARHAVTEAAPAG